MLQMEIQKKENNKIQNKQIIEIQDYCHAICTFQNCIFHLHNGKMQFKGVFVTAFIAISKSFSLSTHSRILKYCIELLAFAKNEDEQRDPMLHSAFRMT